MAIYSGKSTLHDYLVGEDIPNGTHVLEVNGVNIDIEMCNYLDDFEVDTQGVENIVPVLTSNTANVNFKASASSEYTVSPGYLAWRAFVNGVNGTLCWATAQFNTTGWLQMTMVTARRVSLYYLCGQTGRPLGSPKNWTFEASDDGEKWTVIDTREHVTGWVDNTWKGFAVPVQNIGLYKMYRLNVTANNGDTNFLTIGAMQLIDSFGDETLDSKMLVLKFHKNLTVNTGATLIPRVRKKGMTVYVGGKLTNKGTISMTAKGAIATGQNVYLYQNNDGSFEYVPAMGAVGGTSVTGGAQSVTNAGRTGVAGTARRTGGGGSGGGGMSNPHTGTFITGRGGTGTSYSGGAGGGGAWCYSGNAWAGAGSDIGGAGGNAASTYGTSRPVGGGAGNGGGTALGGLVGGAGTGGLLIIYATIFDNTGTVSSIGSVGGAGGNGGGGSSGGGSINVFYTTLVNRGTTNANGGAGATAGSTGGAGAITFSLMENTTRFDGGLDVTSTHTNDVLLSGIINDTMGLDVQYRITVNDDQVFPQSGFTDLAPRDLPVRYDIANSLLRYGTNTVRLFVRNSNGKVSVYVYTVALESVEPSITASMIGMRLDVVVEDPEMDRVRIQVILNGVSIYPEHEGYTELTESPLVYGRTLYSNEVVIGADNTVEVLAMDSYGAQTSVTLPFTGSYSGVMFSDENGVFYSDDLGNVLSYLNIGWLAFGETSAVHAINVINRTGTVLGGFALTSNMDELPADAAIEFSLSNEPFTPSTSISYSEALSQEDVVTFYVRMIAGEGEDTGVGEFEIAVDY